MKKIYLLLFSILLYIFSCKTDDTVPVVETVNNVNFNINDVPYAKLSTYSFFVGDIKNMFPSAKVIPYEPASSLFTDYASKKKIYLDACRNKSKL